MADIQKGKISTIEGPEDENGNSTRARVIPDRAGGIVTKPLVIAQQLRGSAVNLTKGTEVVFTVFPDQTGIILSLADGSASYGHQIIPVTQDEYDAIEAAGAIVKDALYMIVFERG